jgi:MFS transporter, UMF1 family
MGRVSGFSWAVSYGAALALLVITAGAMQVARLETPDEWRPFFVFSGLWFLGFTIPTLLWLKEPKVPHTVHPGRNLITAGFVRIGESIRSVAQYRDLAMLLLASLFYGTGMSVVIFFASKLAGEFGFTQVNLVVFVAVITISGIVGTFLPTLYQDRMGHRRSTLLYLYVWIATSIAFALYAYLAEAHNRVPGAGPYPTWPLWIIGNLLGFGLGSLGASNRAFVGFLAPPSRAGEVFGLWGLMFKLAAIMTFPFAWVKDTAGTPAALLVLAGFLIVGAVITLFVDEKRGHEAAAHDPAEVVNPGLPVVE